jgi:hypothetical protein
MLRDQSEAEYPTMNPTADPNPTYGFLTPENVKLLPKNGGTISGLTNVPHFGPLISGPPSGIA